MARDNPQIPVLENRVRVLSGAIGSEMAKVAGDRSSLSSKTPQYEGITLDRDLDRKSTRLNSSHLVISYAVFCLKKKKQHLYRCARAGCLVDCLHRRGTPAKRPGRGLYWPLAAVASARQPTPRPTCPSDARCPTR